MPPESAPLPDRSSAQQIYCVECHDDGTLQPVVRKLGAWWCPRHRDEGTVRFAEALGLADPLKRGVPTIIFASHGYADVEAYDRLRAENEALKAILDGTDVGALDRALRASYKRGYPPEEREGWESYAERCPGVVAHMRESVRAMFAAALASGAPDDSEVPNV